MRAPGFWRGPESGAPEGAQEGAFSGAFARLVILALQPAAFIYGRLTARRMARKGARVGVPVICIGNFVAGGAGKTPTALAVGMHLAAMGAEQAFVSRGYGGRLSAAPAPTRVDPTAHYATDVGDEPLLLAVQGPTFIHRDRCAAALCAVAAGAQAIVLDDGLQNPSLHKDLTLAVVDGAVGVGNGQVLPAGPLRAPLADQWRHVDALVVIGDGAAGEILASEATGRGKPVLRARLAPDPGVAARLKGRQVLAFAGIGRPEKFAETLRQFGAGVVELVSFGDHQSYSARDLTPLAARAAQQGLTLVTTAKDAARMAGDASLAPFLAQVIVLPVSLVFADDAALAGLLRRVMAGAEPPGMA